MAEFTPNPTQHFTAAAVRAMKLTPEGSALSRRPPLRPRIYSSGMVYPMPHYLMWRGNTTQYQYNTSFFARWGEGDTRERYHQYFAHAKDPTDYDKPGRDYELLKIHRGKRRMVKPMPRPQYVDPNAKVSWVFRSWSDLLSTLDPWQREVHYPSHVPEHIGAQRPLSPLAPSVYHKHLHLAYMTQIDVTVCPFFFGHGPSLQRTVLNFYRRCLSARAILPKDKINLHYTIDDLTPSIEVTWLDGTTYSPPLLEGSTSQSIIQRIMEQAWLQRDKLEAAGKNLQPLSIDDYKWNEVIKFKKQKKADAKKK